MAGALEPLCRRVLATGKPILDVEVEAATPARPAETRDWLLDLYPHHRADGRLVGVSMTVEEVTEKRTMERLQRRFLQEVLLAQESERTRIARELHDETGSALTSLAIGLRNAARLGDDEVTRAQFGRLQEQLDRTIDEVRRLAHGLHPLALEQLGLGPAVEQHALTCASSYGVEVQVRVNDLPASIPEHVATALYRVFQEALANVLKHAGAGAVTVVLDHRGGELIMVIEDDGRGMETLTPAALAAAGKLGIHGMRERVALLQGTLSIEPTPGGGTTLFVKVPVREADHA
jgi:signal transduction histidine kinase